MKRGSFMFRYKSRIGIIYWNDFAIPKQKLIVNCTQMYSK